MLNSKTPNQKKKKTLHKKYDVTRARARVTHTKKEKKWAEPLSFDGRIFFCKE